MSLPEGVLLMDLFQNFTEDQIALMGCFVALLTSVALMYVSVFLNRSQRKTETREMLKPTLSIATHDERPEVEPSHRKVA
jgi:hypothetical protein